MLHKPELFSNGFHLSHFTLGEEIKHLVINEEWILIDQEFKKLTAPQGRLFNFLKTFHDFNSIEFIISIRDSKNDWEEDGIWHDDGSRVFAFSLSLTIEQDKLKGGRLGIRQIGTEEMYSLPTPFFGGIILFLTGIYGFEHRIHQVTEGKRIIIAGWCS